MPSIENHTNLAEIVDALTAAYETQGRHVSPDKRTSVIPLNIENGRIFDSITNKPIEKVFSNDGSHASKETQINLNMLYDVLRSGPQTLGLWLSPPIPNMGVPTGKILVAGKREVKGQKQIVEYDVTGLDFTPLQFLEFHQLLKKHYRDGYYLIDEIPWEVLSNTIPMPKAWEKMKNGLAEKEFKKAIDKWLVKVNGKSYEFFIPLMDRELGSNIREACPRPGGVGFVSISLNKIGEELHKVRECPNCHYDVAGHHPEGIPSGWHCPGCGGEYQGC